MHTSQYLYGRYHTILYHSPLSGIASVSFLYPTLLWCIWYQLCTYHHMNIVPSLLLVSYIIIIHHHCHYCCYPIIIILSSSSHTTIITRHHHHHSPPPRGQDVIIAKARTLEIRTTPNAADSQQLPLLTLVAVVPIHGRIVSLHAIPWHNQRSLIFVATERWQYAVLGYDEETPKKYSPYPLVTHASGSLSANNLTQSVGAPDAAASGTAEGANDGPPLLGREAETGPIVAVHDRCIVLHIFEGIFTVLPINQAYPTNRAAYKTGGTNIMTPTRHTPASSFLSPPFHCRVEERNILAMTFVPVYSSAANNSPLPLLSILYQDARGVQHMTTHMIHLGRQHLFLHGSSSVPPNSPAWWKKTAVDGGSALLLPVPPRVPAVAAAARSSQTTAATTTTAITGGVLVVGQRQLTYTAPAAPTKIIPVPQALYLAYVELPPDPDGGGLPRFLLADEFGNLHMLSLVVAGTPETATNHIQGLQLETLGSCNLATSMAYLGQGLVFVGSALGDSQLVQIHDEPFSEQAPVKKGDEDKEEEEEDDDDMLMLENTYLQVMEEFPNLGPILDFDLIPTTLGTGANGTTANAAMGGAASAKDPTHQPIVPSQVVTASGSSKSGTIRLIRNGIGMKESASVDIPGIAQMWALRQSFGDSHDAYLVQSFVGETRVLGVVETSFADEDEGMGEDAEDEVGGALEEVVLAGMNSTVPTLYMGNLESGDRWLQITPEGIRLIAATKPNDMAIGDAVVDTWHVSSKENLPGNPIITVAAGNDAGQVAVALTGGYVLYFCVTKDKIHAVSEKKMEQEVSCLSLHPFRKPSESDMMEDEGLKGAEESRMLAVGLWEDYTVRLLSLENQLEELSKIRLQEESPAADDEGTSTGVASHTTRNHRNQMMMARSVCLVTLDFSGGNNSNNGANAGGTAGVDMLFVGLGDGTLISFAIVVLDGRVSAQAKKEVCLGTQRIDLVPLSTNRGGTCIMATGDRPTVIYLAGVSGSSSATQVNPKLCYSNVNLAPSEDDEGEGFHQQPSEQSISVNCAAPFYSPLLFDSDALGSQHYSLCVADDSSLKLGIIDDIQKLHVTTCRLGMAPRRVVHCAEGRLFAVGCVESGIKHIGLGGPETNSMSNCIRFMDDTTFEDLDRVDLEPYETIMSMAYASLKVPQTQDSSADTYRKFLIVGTAYVLPDEDEPTRGKIMLYSCEADPSSAGSTNRQVRPVTELFTQGSVYSICQFYEGTILCTINTKTMVAKLVDDTGVPRLQFIGNGHHGHILSYCVRSMAEPTSMAETEATGTQQTMTAEGSDPSKNEEKKEMLAIVGDLMRSIGLVQYYPEHSTLEEVARDFNPNWTTAIEMLTEDVYLGAENWGNFFCLRRNKAATSEEVRFRLDSIGEFNLSEMCNKFMRGSLVMPVSTSTTANSSRRQLRPSSSPQKGKDGKMSVASRTVRPAVVTGSQTLFGTTDGTLGVVLGLDSRTAAFFGCLEKAMSRVIRPVGDFSHESFRACKTERRTHPAHGFVDGDLVETFVDLDQRLMELVVKEMNRDGGWEVDDVVLRPDSESLQDVDGRETSLDCELTVDDVLSMVEEISMLH